MRNIRLALTVLASLVLASSLAHAQVTTSIAGVIVDSSGAFIPGATVTVKNNATTAESFTTSGENGTFAIPALNPGTYTVTVTLTGFKTAVVNDVVLTGGTPGSVKVTLEVGAIEETVTVQGGSEIIQTQSPTISTTVDANRIINLPLSSRSGLDFVVFLPGVNTAGGSRDSIINGLPQSAIAITWDGVNVQDNHLKTTDGFFAIISPRLDAIEEVTLTTAAQGAEATGQGATRINFVTRSGSNRYSGSAYHYYRNDALNSNTWSRNRDGLPKANLLQNQPGARFGGPIWIPKVYNGRDKAFFFVNYEQFRQPGEFTVEPHDPAPPHAAGILPLQRGGRRAGGQRAAACRRRRTPVGCRSDRRAAAQRHPRIDRHHRHDPAGHQPEPRDIQLPGREQQLQLLPDGPHRLQPHAEPPADRDRELPELRELSRTRPTTRK